MLEKIQDDSENLEDKYLDYEVDTLLEILSLLYEFKKDYVSAIRCYLDSYGKC